MTLAQRQLVVLRHDRERLSLAYTQALREGEPSWKLECIRNNYERVTRELTRRVMA